MMRASWQASDRGNESVANAIADAETTCRRFMVNRATRPKMTT
jgi:hypothetical protein